MRSPGPFLELAGFLQTGDALDLDVEAEELRADRGAGGGGVAEVTDVNFVHLLEIFRREIRQIHTRADDVRKIGSGGGEDFLDVVEDEFGLAGDRAALDFSRGGVPGRHAGDEDEFSFGEHAERVGTKGGRAAGDVAEFGFHGWELERIGAGDSRAEKRRAGFRHGQRRGGEHRIF